MALAAIGRSLAHRNYRLFFFGQTVSLIGTWMQQTASPWLVLKLTDSPLWLGLVAAAGQLPAFVVSPFAGVIMDQVPRRRLLVVTQALMMVQALLLAVLTLCGKVEAWHVLVLSVGLGVVNAFDLTGRQAFLSEMIERPEDLSNAIALNSSMFNGARLVGPSLAGLVIAAAGEGVCFLLNGVSYLAVLAALLAMRLAPRPWPAGPAAIWGGLREGVAYAFGSPPIRALLALVALVSLLAVPYAVMIPVYVKEKFDGDARLLGVFLSAPGVGAVTGALVLASRRDVLGLLRRIAWAPAVIGAALLAFSFAERLALALPILFVIGFAVAVLLSACNTTLQTIVDEDKRGRVMSLYAMAFMGLAPLGSLATGALAERAGVMVTLRAGGAACLVAAAAFAAWLDRPLRERVTAIYREKGLVRKAPGPPGA
jgi:MFS family permease